MRRMLWLLLLVAVQAMAATIKLYLKDGNYHIVREYQVQTDRVRFYSLERSAWEEMPLELIDLKRTEGAQQERSEALREEAAALAAEDQAEREAAREVSRVPVDNGVYLVDGEKLTPLKQAESKAVSNKRRSVLKVLSPIPIIAGKATVELDGKTSATVVSAARPEFYIRLYALERFGIFRLKPEKDSRIVQKWSIVPVTKEIVEEQEEIEIFRRQVGDGLYKIWPEKPLDPGEYAVVEYTEGKGNIQVWDFALKPAAGK